MCLSWISGTLGLGVLRHVFGVRYAVSVLVMWVWGLQTGENYGTGAVLQLLENDGLALPVVRAWV